MIRSFITTHVRKDSAIPALKWNPTQIHAQRNPEFARDDVSFSQVGHGFLRRELLAKTEVFHAKLIKAFACQLFFDMM